MYRLSVALCALALTLSACDSDPADSSEFDVLPLAVGESWTMQETTTVVYDDGAPVDTTLAETPRLATLAVVRDSVIAGERWARIEFTSERRFASQLVPDRGAWFTHRESSLYRLDDDGTARLLYRLDGTPGRPFVSDGLREVELARRETVVTVPAGDVMSAVFTQTEKSVDVPGLAGVPISPRVPTTQAFSATAGPVVLEVLYVRTSSDGEALLPLRLRRYELVRGEA